MTIRAKRSRGNKAQGRRKFEVRVIDFADREDLIEFRNARYKDFELRQRDLVIFSFVQGKLKLVQNLTINQVYEVSEPWCYLATYIYGEGSAEVALLRSFRDEVLLQWRPTSRLVDCYYALSPRAIEILGNSVLCKVVLRLVLSPVIRVVEKGFGRTNRCS